MKKTICLLLALCLVFSMTGCRKKKNNNQSNTTGVHNTQSTANNEQITDNKEMVAVSVPAVTEDTLATDNNVLFQYTYQHISLILNKPDVADRVILDFLNRVDSTKESADSVANMAKSAYRSGQNWIPYLYQVIYSPTRIDHNVLSFSGSIEVFSGAPHPERSCISASYDLQTGDTLTLASIMTKDASVDVFCNFVLDGLKELAEGDHLYENYQGTVKDRFKVDPSTDESWYFTQTGLCFYFSPYEIAPYASGIITVEIPYEKLTGVLHEDYLPLKRNVPQGSIQISPFNNVDLNGFSQFAEVVTNKEGSMFLAQTDNYVQDIRLQIANKSATYTVFAAYALHQGDGIMIQTDDATREKLKLTYKTGTQTATATIG